MPGYGLWMRLWPGFRGSRLRSPCGPLAPPAPRPAGVEDRGDRHRRPRHVSRAVIHVLRGRAVSRPDRLSPRSFRPGEQAAAPSKAAESPVSAACTTGRPVSAARSAPSAACCAGRPACLEGRVGSLVNDQPGASSVSTLDMSGKADSKQISTPTVRGRPPGVVTCRTCAPIPGTTFCGAARLIVVEPARGPGGTGCTRRTAPAWS